MPPLELPKDKRIYGLGVLFFCIFLYAFAFSTPRGFPVDTIVTLEKGEGLAQISEKLESMNIVRSNLWFRATVIFLVGEGGIQAGDYSLEEKQNTLTLAWRMTRGKHGVEEVKITVPEGFTNKEISALFDERFANFDEQRFLDISREGYMFPDTYFVRVNATTDDVVELFRNNYESKISPLREKIRESGRTENDIIKMASIIEGEVQTLEDKQTISGILWKRLSIGMALQVDADPNTYEEPGLPKKPINNPGLLSIEAALTPKSSPYFYFLNAKKDGATYFAETLEDHILNIQKHL